MLMKMHINVENANRVGIIFELPLTEMKVKILDVKKFGFVFWRLILETSNFKHC